MKILFKKNVWILKKLGRDSWGNQIYGDKRLLNDVCMDVIPDFGTRDNKRVFEPKITLTLFGPLPKSLSIDKSIIGSKIVDDDQEEYYVKDIEMIKGSDGNITQYHLILEKDENHVRENNIY